jgi:hypothetical protein
MLLRSWTAVKVQLEATPAAGADEFVTLKLT